MKVRMIRNATGSPDGLHVRLYKAGEKHDLPDSLAEVFLKLGSAEEDKELTLETKDETGAEKVMPKKSKKSKRRD